MKRISELRDLSDDHHTGLVLARRCKQAGREGSPLPPDEVWGQLIEAFSSHLEPHFQIEESHFLPALEAIGERSHALRIREEHSALRLIRDAGTADRATLLRFGEVLEAHIRYEEREVFESTQDRLPRDALAAIEAACQAISRVCTVRFEL